MCAGLEKRSWPIKVNLPDTVTLVYSEDLPKTLRKKIEGKQTRLPKENEKTKPSHPVIIAAAQMEETDGQRWAKMPSRLRTRDQKRALHNITAVEKGLHRFPPFTRMDEWTMRCLRCERDIEFWSWSVQKKICNLSGRLELKCGGEEHSAVRSNGAVSPMIRQLQKQNDKKLKRTETIGECSRGDLCHPSNMGGSLQAMASILTLKTANRTGHSEFQLP